LKNRINLDNRLDPFTFTLLLAIDKSALKVTLVCPNIFTKTVRKAFPENSDVYITIFVHLCTLSMFCRIVPFALVSVTVGCYLHSKSICEAVLPLPSVRVSFGPTPHAITMLPALIPLAFIRLPFAGPKVLSITFSFSSRELSDIDVAILIYLVPTALS